MLAHEPGDNYRQHTVSIALTQSKSKRTVRNVRYEFQDQRLAERREADSGGVPFISGQFAVFLA
jgi:hypothetical protein